MSLQLSQPLIMMWQLLLRYVNPRCCRSYPISPLAQPPHYTNNEPCCRSISLVPAVPRKLLCDREGILCVFDLVAFYAHGVICKHYPKEIWRYNHHLTSANGHTSQSTSPSALSLLSLHTADDSCTLRDIHCIWSDSGVARRGGGAAYLQ